MRYSLIPIFALATTVVSLPPSPSEASITASTAHGIHPTSLPEPSALSTASPTHDRKSSTPTRFYTLPTEHGYHGSPHMKPVPRHMLDVAGVEPYLTSITIIRGPKTLPPLENMPVHTLPVGREFNGKNTDIFGKPKPTTIYINPIDAPQVTAEPGWPRGPRPHHSIHGWRPSGPRSHLISAHVTQVPEPIPTGFTDRGLEVEDPEPMPTGYTDKKYIFENPDDSILSEYPCPTREYARDLIKKIGFGLLSGDELALAKPKLSLLSHCVWAEVKPRAVPRSPLYIMPFGNSTIGSNSTKTHVPTQFTGAATKTSAAKACLPLLLLPLLLL